MKYQEGPESKVLHRSYSPDLAHNNFHFLGLESTYFRKPLQHGCWHSI